MSGSGPGLANLPRYRKSGFGFSCKSLAFPLYFALYCTKNPQQSLSNGPKTSTIVIMHHDADSTCVIRYSGRRNRQAAPRAAGRAFWHTIVDPNVNRNFRVPEKSWVCQIVLFDRFHKVLWPPELPGGAQVRREGVWAHYRQPK